MVPAAGYMFLEVKWNDTRKTICFTREAFFGLLVAGFSFKWQHFRACVTAHADVHAQMY